MTLNALETKSRDAITRDPGPNDRPDVVVPILRSGALARQFCQSVGRANVEAVFERSFYLRCGDEFMCVGAPAIGNGPLTLIGDLGPLARVGLQPGRPALICGRHIRFGNAIRFDLDRCEPWHPPSWPMSQPAIRLADTYAELARCAAVEAPREGFARYVFDAHGPFMRPPPAERIMRGRIADFEGWVVAVLNPDHASVDDLATPVEDLIGLGPGLTPSGDDFLVGALALLDALGERATHAALARAITGAPLARTSPLSRCFLGAAAAGHIGENLHRAVSSVMVGDIDAAVAAAGQIGHSSGWDMMAGIGTVLRVAAAAQPKS
jgi:Protein of unknown function (DUF2877)